MVIREQAPGNFVPTQGAWNLDAVELCLPPS